MSSDDNQDDRDEIVTEEMLWDRIPQTEGEDRAETYYELSARIFARGQYDEALALAETARDIYAEMGASAPSEGLAQAYSAIGYNLNQLKRIIRRATLQTPLQLPRHLVQNRILMRAPHKHRAPIPFQLRP